MYNQVGIFLIGLSLGSCVSTKVFRELQNKYNDLKTERNHLVDSLQNLGTLNEANQNKLELQKVKLSSVVSENNQMKQDYTAIKANLETLRASYDMLEKNRNSEIVKNAQRNRDMLILLDEKQKNFNKESTRLREAEKELKKRSDKLKLVNQKLSQRAENLEDLRYNLYQESEKIKKLKAIIAKKNNEANILENKISKTLKSFKDKGLTINRKNGKIYVSMQNELLFSSGSYDVEYKGEQAIKQLGKILENNPNILIQIEGHTDHMPFVSNSLTIKDNWDLSAKRAASVVRKLIKNPKINPKNIIAVARGSYDPISDNNTPEGRAKNRRIDVVLIPNLNQILKLLKTSNEIQQPSTNETKSQ